MSGVCPRVAPDPSSPAEEFACLAALVVERLLVTDGVAASKFRTGAPVDDPAREARVLEQVRTEADAVGADPDVAVAFFRNQIAASKVVQQGLLARWSEHPDAAPATRPDLDQVRERLDRLTTGLLRELAAVSRLHEDPGVRAARLARAGRSHAARLDPLHRRALGAATRTGCGGPVTGGRRPPRSPE